VVRLRPPSRVADSFLRRSTILARESFLLRTDPRVLDALRRWADDELRSVNGQVDYLLRRALQDAGRLKPADEQKKDSKEK
jgi:hypothetical protein